MQNTLSCCYRIAELENELKKLRADADGRVRGIEDEANALKKKLVMEIESLTVRLQVRHFPSNQSKKAMYSRCSKSGLPDFSWSEHTKLGKM
jgi:phage host-nuclease inhibitor protein Gam